MAIVPFLAMTAAEMENLSHLPQRLAWMACHFSPYGLGLSNLPRELPADSLLIVDDITPPRGHDPLLIEHQLIQCVEMLPCSGILLDFQRADCEETAALAAHLIKALPCPTAVSKNYAGDFSCGVILPPPPLSVRLSDYLKPWTGREIWLELGLDGECLRLTENGCEAFLLPYPAADTTGFYDETLRCHYTLQTNQKSASFTLWRTKEDMLEFLQDAETLGISGAVGLYQELSKLS